MIVGYEMCCPTCTCTCGVALHESCFVVLGYDETQYCYECCVKAINTISEMYKASYGADSAYGYVDTYPVVTFEGCHSAAIILEGHVVPGEVDTNGTFHGDTRYAQHLPEHIRDSGGWRFVSGDTYLSEQFALFERRIGKREYEYVEIFDMLEADRNYAGENRWMATYGVVDTNIEQEDIDSILVCLGKQQGDTVVPEEIWEYGVPYTEHDFYATPYTVLLRFGIPKLLLGEAFQAKLHLYSVNEA